MKKENFLKSGKDGCKMRLEAAILADILYSSGKKRNLIFIREKSVNFENVYPWQPWIIKRSSLIIINNCLVMLNLVFVVCCKLAQLTATVNDLTLGYFMMQDFARDQDCCTVLL